MMDGSWEGDEGWKMYTEGEREMGRESEYSVEGSQTDYCNCL